MALGLLGALAFEHYALEFFKDDELLVGVINLGISLFFRDEETGFLETFELALDVTGVFFDKLGQTTDMRLEIGVFGIDHNDLTADTTGDENV